MSKSTHPSTNNPYKIVFTENARMCIPFLNTRYRSMTVCSQILRMHPQHYRRRNNNKRHEIVFFLSGGGGGEKEKCFAAKDIK